MTIHSKTNTKAPIMTNKHQNNKEHIFNEVVAALRKRRIFIPQQIAANLKTQQLEDVPFSIFQLISTCLPKKWFVH